MSNLLRKFARNQRQVSLMEGEQPAQGDYRFTGRGRGSAELSVPVVAADMHFERQKTGKGHTWPAQHKRQHIKPRRRR